MYQIEDGFYMFNRKTMHITLCVVTELFLKVYFFSEHKVLYLSIPCNVNVFQSSTRSGNVEKNPEEGGGGTPPPLGEKKNFSIFSFLLGHPGIMSCWLHASLAATSCITYILPFQKIRKRELSNQKMTHHILITYMYYFSLFCPRL